MSVRETLKKLLQICADMQDSFWEAAAHARMERLPAVFEEAAIQWNGFADKIFALLLEVNHTSPDASWKANPARSWMNPARVPVMDDAAICEECLTGLEMASDELRKAAVADDLRVRRAATDQLGAATGQKAVIHKCAADIDHRIV
jgi:hypothetical protein